jgi:hypothetical protein
MSLPARSRASQRRLRRSGGAGCEHGSCRATTSWPPPSGSPGATARPMSAPMASSTFDGEATAGSSPSWSRRSRSGSSGFSRASRRRRSAPSPLPTATRAAPRLEWFLERYPLSSQLPTARGYDDGRLRFERIRAEIEQVLRGDWTPSERAGAAARRRGAAAEPGARGRDGAADGAADRRRRRRPRQDARGARQ